MNVTRGLSLWVSCLTVCPQVSSEDDGASFLNEQWHDFYSRTGIQCDL